MAIRIIGEDAYESPEIVPACPPAWKLKTADVSPDDRAEGVRILLGGERPA
jgi:hypothetical protein